MPRIRKAGLNMASHPGERTSMLLRLHLAEFPHSSYKSFTFS